jgi:hypothetical protein
VACRIANYGASLDEAGFIIFFLATKMKGLVDAGRLGNLPPECLRSVLQEDQLDVESEQGAVDIIYQWLQGQGPLDEGRRRELFRFLFSAIRPANLKYFELEILSMKGEIRDNRELADAVGHELGVKSCNQGEPPGSCSCCVDIAANLPILRYPFDFSIQVGPDSPRGSAPKEYNDALDFRDFYGRRWWVALPAPAMLPMSFCMDVPGIMYAPSMRMPLSFYVHAQSWHCLTLCGRGFPVSGMYFYDDL